MSPSSESIKAFLEHSVRERPVRLLERLFFYNDERLKYYQMRIFDDEQTFGSIT